MITPGRFYSTVTQPNKPDKYISDIKTRPEKASERVFVMRCLLNETVD